MYKETGGVGGRLKKSFKSLEEEAIRRALQESKEQKKKSTLPSLHKFIEEESKKRYSSLENSKERETSAADEHANTLETVNHSTYELEGSMGFKNLKQKYLELKQLSLHSKKKSELLDKPQYRRY